MSKELTEKWKAGELKEGYYYIKYEDNYIGIAFACEWIGRYEYPCVGFEFEEDIEEILAPVPSYEELQRLESDSLAKKEGEEIVAELNYKNKELLKRNKEQRKKIHILTESQMKLENTIGELGKQNARLKELLKECKEHLCHHYCQITVGKLEKKIEEALK